MSAHEISFRMATHSDVPSIVRLLADDELGSLREKYENQYLDTITLLMS